MLHIKFIVPGLNRIKSSFPQTVQYDVAMHASAIRVRTSYARERTDETNIWKSSTEVGNAISDLKSTISIVIISQNQSGTPGRF